jgi:ribonuclease HI
MILHLETDASCNFQRSQPRLDLPPLMYAGAGIVIRTVSMRLVAMHSIRLGFVPCPHQAEYLALLKGLELVKAHGATGLFARSDSLPMVRQVTGEIEDGGEGISDLAHRIAVLQEGFAPFKLRWSPATHRKTRGDGVPTADLLAERASGVLSSTR